MHDFQVAEILMFLLRHNIKDIPKPLLEHIDNAMTKLYLGKEDDAYLIGKRIKHLEDLYDKYEDYSISQI